MTTYRQCALRNGERLTYGWVPYAVARKHTRVQLLDVDGQYWTVADVYGMEVSAEEVSENARKYTAFQGSLKGGGIDAKQA